MKTTSFTLNRAKLAAGAAPVALGMAMLCAPTAASAQADATTAASGAPIVVTGTRVARPDLESVSPLTVVGAEEVANTGTTRIEDLINQLPQAVAGQNAFIANGASGTATVNLRGLGTARTLVLVNGRRLQPGDPFVPVADLNQIPPSLVERVEVITGGASAVYGADAVAGVVNFIMDTDFEGVQLDTTFSFYQHDNNSNQLIDDGRNALDSGPVTIRDRLDQRGFGYPTDNQIDGFTYDTTLTLGAGFDDGRGHVTAYLGYRQNDPVLQADRDHSACALSRTPNNTDGRILCGGSSNSPNALVVDPTFGGFFVGVGADGDWVGDGSTNDPPYNYAPINFFQRNNKRYTAGFFADYEFAENVTAYAEFMFMDSSTIAQIAESGTFFADIYNVRCGDDPATAAVEAPSPLLSASQAADLCNAGFDGEADAGDGDAGVDTNGDGVPDLFSDVPPDGVVPLLIGKRNVEGGGRQADLRHTAYRMVAGVRGDISENWRFDGFLQYGTTLFNQTYLNDFSRRRLLNAINAVDDGTGNIVCAINADANPSNDDAFCAPYNPFQGAGLVTDPAQGVTQAALNYVQVPGFTRASTEEWVANGYVTGELANITGFTPVSIVLGAEYRKEQLNRRNDLAFSTGDLAGQGGPTPDVVGEFSVREVFGELVVPLVENASFADYLGLELGYRMSDYTTVGTTHTYKIAGEYAPVPWVRFRGGYNRAVRAPNIIELFAPQQLALFGGTDPCAGPAPEQTPAQCALSGVSAAQYGNIASSPADQYNQLISGDPNLEEERATTWTVGMVLDAGGIGLSGLTFTVDYFDIEVTNAVSTLGAQNIATQCGLSGDPLFCDKIVRDPISGNLWAGQNGFVINPNLNIGGVATEGLDFSANLRYPLGPGVLTANFQGTYLFEATFDNGFTPVGLAGGDGVFDCVGFHGPTCGQPSFEWRHQMRLGYRHDNGIGGSIRWRHFGSSQLEQFSTDPDLSTSTNPDSRGNIESWDFFDIVFNFELSDELGFTAGINNLFDRDPPLIATGFGSTNANTFANVYDPIGRYVFLSAQLRF